MGCALQGRPKKKNWVWAIFVHVEVLEDFDTGIGGDGVGMAAAEMRDGIV